MATGVDRPPPARPLDYSAPVPQPGLSRPAALACATLCLIIGIPICAIGFGVLTAVSGWNDLDLYRALGFIAVGGVFCYAGMRFKRQRGTPAG